MLGSVVGATAGTLLGILFSLLGEQSISYTTALVSLAEITS